VNTFLESILTGLRGGVVVVDADLVIRVWNERAERMWGLRAHEAQGQHLLNLDIGLPVESLRSTLKSVLSGEQSQVELTVDATNRFGKPVTCTISCTPLVSPTGEVDGAIVVMEELSQAS
jgi:two-component system CheB/CheR fusion protein